MSFRSRRPSAIVSFALGACAGFGLIAPAAKPPVAPAAAAAQAPAAPAAQIDWQRSLADALAVSQAQARPLLIAVNMDGESASERIVVERYRDPEFVRLTERFTCLVASAFRHSTRDHDERGRRVPCPRLGQITCGEHVALEPILYEQFLGGQRISPRHTLVLPDGKKVFDLFLLFDLRELDRKLAETQELAPPPAPARSPLDTGSLDSPPSAAQWLALAGARDARGRARFEAALAATTAAYQGADYRDAETHARVLELLEMLGDRGVRDALRVLVAKNARGVGATARSIGIGSEIGAYLRARISAGLFAAEELRELGDADRETVASRSLLLSFVAAGGRREWRDAGWLGAPAPDEPARALEGLALDPAARSRVEAAVAASGGPLAPELDPMVLSRLVAAGSAEPPRPPARGAPPENAEELLAEADAGLQERPGDANRLLAFGRAALAVAEKRMAEGGAGIDLLLGDAETALAKAAAVFARDVSVRLDLARTCYLASRFEEEERWAIEALGLLPPPPADFTGDVRAVLAEPPERLEALRWVGDGSARLLAARSGGDPAVEAAGIARGARTLALAALTPGSGETDWLSLASFFGALGRRGDEIGLVESGLQRFPDSQALWHARNVAWGSLGEPQRAAAGAELIADRASASGTAAWYAGYAWISAGDEARRASEPDRAVEAYGRAGEWFAKSLALRPDFADSANYYQAMAELGRGFAHLLADRRSEAAGCLVEAIRIRPAIARVRDALDREPLDLLDGALEWRKSGASPVDAAQLARRLVDVDPGNAEWPRAVSDSELREALRALGRDDAAAAERYFAASVAAARLAIELARDPESVRALAQPLAIQGELALEAKDAARARPFLAEAAVLLELDAGAGTDALALGELAKRLREKLGEARPLIRPGR